MDTNIDIKRFARLGAMVAGVMMLSGVGAAPPANATDLFIGRSSCTGLNCNSLLLKGTVNAYGQNNDIPGAWVTKVWGADAGSCMRLDLTNSNNIDYEMTVVAPNGSVFRNDDRGVADCPRCPLVKVSSTQLGWYTVIIHSFSGSVVNNNFEMRYGTYTPGNPNCNSPTTPLSVASRGPKTMAAGASNEADAE